MWWITALNLMKSSVIPFLETYWKPIIIGIGVIVYSFFWYSVGVNHVQNKWDKSIQDATIKAHQIEADNQILSNSIGGKYATGIKIIDDNYNAAINSLQPAGSNMPGKANSSSGIIRTTCTDAVYKANARLKLAREAEINTQRLISLQEWVRGVQ